MRPLAFLSPSVTFALIVAASSACAEEVVTVQLEPTVDSARRDAAEKVLNEDLPRYRLLWESQRGEVESYVVSRSAGLRYDFPCDKVPIRVSVHNGSVLTATYAETSGDCVLGQVATLPTYNWPIPSPDQLFDWIVLMASPPTNSRLYGCLLASFDRTTGIPTKIEAGCPTHIDDFLIVEVSDIRIRK
jgi:hypothetical protein